MGRDLRRRATRRACASRRSTGTSAADEAEYIIETAAPKAVVLDGSLADLVPAAADVAVRLAIGPSTDAIAGWDDYEAALAAESGDADRRPGARLDHALHVGHHRPTEGRLPAARGPGDRARPRRASPATSRGWSTS